MSILPQSITSHKNQRNFTLIELTVVIAIIILITGIAVISVTRMPAGMVITNTVAKVEKLMVTAQTQASLRGEQRNLNFDFEKNVFYISEPDRENENTPVSTGASEENSYIIDEDITLEFPEYNEDRIQYRFFPDGSASGPDMILSLNGQKRLITVSPLTGIVFVKDVSND